MEVPITQARFARISAVLVFSLVVADLSWASRSCRDILLKEPAAPLSGKTESLGEANSSGLGAKENTALTSGPTELSKETKIFFSDFAKAKELAKQNPVGSGFSFVDVNKTVYCITSQDDSGTVRLNCAFLFRGVELMLNEEEMTGLEMHLKSIPGEKTYVTLNDKELICDVFPQDATEAGFKCALSPESP